MTSIARTAAHVPATVTGPAHTWIRDGAIAGGGIPLAHAGMIALDGWWWLSAEALAIVVGVTAVGAISGAALGAITPPLLERTRGRVPLWMLVLLLTTMAATVAMLATTAVTTFLGFPQGLSLGVYAAFVAAVLGGVAWLPYLVAAVTRRPTLPIAIAVAVAAPWIIVAVNRVLHVVL